VRVDTATQQSWLPDEVVSGQLVRLGDARHRVEARGHGHHGAALLADEPQRHRQRVQRPLLLGVGGRGQLHRTGAHDLAPGLQLGHVAPEGAALLVGAAVLGGGRATHLVQAARLFGMNSVYLATRKVASRSGVVL
jgi:hypothetical protein